jgi:outer membrane protein assembly factor BamA
MKRTPVVFLLIPVLGGILWPVASICQDSVGKQPAVFQQMDIYDWMIGKKWIKNRPQKKSFLLVIPIVASNPTAGIIMGAGLTYTYKASAAGFKLSNITGNATYSTKGLVNLNIKSNVFVLNERIVLNGDWRYLVNTETTYGLGSQKYTPVASVDLNGYDAVSDSTGQPLEFSQVRIHETISRQLFPDFFAGIGFQFDSRFHIKDETASRGDSAKSFHYQYSRANGFNPEKYITSGAGINLLYDSRDNQVNAHRGYYANINYLVNLTALGSTSNSTLLLTEYRSFHALDNRKRGHVLALWLYGSFVVSGKMPYLALPAIGNDQRQRSGRGYPFGTFRGNDLLTGESEYRFPISRKTGMLGGVLFLNTTTTSNRKADIRLLQYLRPAWGGGLRLMIEKRSRTRLQVDVAMTGKNVGVYFGAQETF